MILLLTLLPRICQNKTLLCIKSSSRWVIIHIPVCVLISRGCHTAGSGSLQYHVRPQDLCSPVRRQVRAVWQLWGPPALFLAAAAASGPPPDEPHLTQTGPDWKSALLFSLLAGELFLRGGGGKHEWQTSNFACALYKSVFIQLSN